MVEPVFDYRFFVEAQKIILGKIRPFLSGKIVQKIKQSIKFGDLRFFRLFGNFKEGLLNLHEFLGEVYKTFDGLYYILRVLNTDDIKSNLEKCKGVLDEKGWDLVKGLMEVEKSPETLRSLYPRTERELQKLRDYKLVVLNNKF